MKPPPFDYYAPATLEEALDLMARHGYGAKALAGGQSLVPTMNFRLAAPSVLVDLNRIPDLGYIRPASDGGLLIGAMTRHVQVEKSPKVADIYPLLHATMPKIAHPQIRNRGTFGGSIAHADPAAELPALLRAVGGRVKAQSARGSRWIPADDFFQGFFTTALAEDELITEVHLPPLPANSGWAVEEVSRRHGDFALVGVMAVVGVDASGRCEQVRIALFGVGDGPMLASTAMGVLRGERLTEEAIATAAEAAAQKDVDPPSDVHATAAFRRHLVNVLVQRTLTQAFARATGQEVNA
jgi:carbon-monoxide dehydrogenase medium subunit